jgi:hypothetical protein
MSHLEWLLERAVARGFGASWWVATVSTTADIAFRRAKMRLRGFIDSGRGPVKVAEPIPFTAIAKPPMISVAGATIYFKSADKPDSLYGDDVYDLVGDEITRWKEESWDACFTTLTATEGHAKLIGNVKGRKNFAYRLARRAEAGRDNWGHHKLTAADAIEGGVITQAAVDEARATLPENVFAELFLAEPAEDSTSPFGLAYIRACLEEKLSEGEPYAWGWDLAKAVDWTVGIAVDRAGLVCRLVRYQRPWLETQADIVRQTRRVPALVDSTGVGDPIVEALQKGRRNFLGFKFTAASKQQLMEGLAVEIQKRGTGFPRGVISAELEAFEYAYTRTGVHYSAPDGMHDDAVCALALALQMRRGRLAKRIRSAWYPGQEEDREAAAKRGNGKGNGKAPAGNGKADPRLTRAAVAAIARGDLVRVAPADWPTVRYALQQAAAKWLDDGDHVRAMIALEEVKRLDKEAAS